MSAWERTWEAEAGKLREMRDGLGAETKALFSDRDRLKEDLEVAWEAIFRTFPAAKQIHQDYIEQRIRKPA